MVLTLTYRTGRTTKLSWAEADGNFQALQTYTEVLDQRLTTLSGRVNSYSDALQNAVNTVTTAYATADALLQDGLDAEVSSRVSAISALQAEITSLSTGNAIPILQAGLAAETSARLEADAVLLDELHREIDAVMTSSANLTVQYYNNLQVEISSLTNKESVDFSTLNSKVAILQSQVAAQDTLLIKQDLTALTNKEVADVATLTTSIATLTAQVGSQDVSVLASSLAAQTAKEAADVLQLQANIDTLSSYAHGQDTATLTANLAAQVQKEVTDVSNLTTSVNNLSAADVSNRSILTALIANETTARQGAVAALQSDLGNLATTVTNNYNSLDTAIQAVASASGSNALTKSVSLTTPIPLPPGITYQCSLALAPTFIITHVLTDLSVWCRIYTDDTSRQNDLPRSIDVDPSTNNNGLLLEFHTDPTLLSFYVMPTTLGYNADTPQTSTVYLTLVNKGTVSAPLNLTLAYKQIS